MPRLRDIRLRTKWTVLFLLIGLIPVLTLWWLQLHQTDQALTQQATLRLETARNNSIADIKRYFSERRADMELLVQIIGDMRRQTLSTLVTLRDLKKERIETFFANHLQDVTLLAGNPDFVKRVAAMDWIFRQAGRKSDDKHWRETVENFSPWIDGRQSASGMEDLYFVSSAGDVVYSLTRQSELGQNIHQKPLKESALARVFHKAMEAPIIQDFQPNAANATPSLYFAAPVKRDGTPIGALLMRFSRSVLTQQLRGGIDPALGIDIYLASTDGLRSDTLHPVANAMSIRPIVQTALTGKTGEGSLIGLQGQPVLSAWAPLKIPGLQWVIVNEQEINTLFVPPLKETKNRWQKFNDTSGYYDMFLIHPDGTVFYSTARQADFATNLATGKYADTNLGQLVQNVLKNKKLALSDLVPYPPSDNQPAFFMAQPVLEKGKVFMVVALQLPPDAISGIMHQVAHGGDVQTFLVGPDQRLRSDGLIDTTQPAPAAAFIGGPITTLLAPTSVNNGLAGQTGTQLTRRINNKPVISSFAPLDVDDNLTWAVIAESELERIIPPNAPPMLLLTLMAGVILMVMMGSWIIKQDLIHPLQDLSSDLNRMAVGRFTTVAESGRKDEMGTLNRSLITVANEFTQASQRMQVALEPLSGRIRHLASFAIAISRDATAGSESIQQTRRDLEEDMRSLVAETNRLLAEQHNALLVEQTLMAIKHEEMAGLTVQAVTEGKRVIVDSITAVQQIHAKIQLVEESTLEMIGLVQKAMDEGVRTSKPGKHGKELTSLMVMTTNLSSAMQTELTAMEQIITDHMQGAEKAMRDLDQMLCALSPAINREITSAPILDHTAQRTLAALDQLDAVFNKNGAAAREVIMTAKSLFDHTTGPLRRATTFFTKNLPPAADRLQATEQNVEPGGDDGTLSTPA
ncbi:MAG: methyl-accepting chemotaxis protein [Magnetococcus sp. YQC-5]